MIKGIKRNFTGGEVSPTIAVRDDLAKYPSSCMKMENFVAQMHGGARYRQGTIYIGETRDSNSAVLIPFEFNTDEEDMYILVFTNGYLQFIQGDEYIMDGASRYEITTQFETHELAGLRYTQVGDILFVTLKGGGLWKLIRSGHIDWEWEPYIDPSPIDSPSNLLVEWGSGGSAGSFTQYYIVTTIDSLGRESLLTSGDVQAKASTSSAKPPGLWAADNVAELTWDAVTGAVEYNIYKETYGFYGLIGVSETNSFDDINYLPNTALSFAKNSEMTSVALDNAPGALAVYQQRVWLGGSVNDPTTLFASRTGDFFDFTTNRPVRDDGSLELMLAFSKIDEIKWIIPFNEMLIGTAGAEYRLFAPSAGAVTPGNVEVKPQSFHGSSDIVPLITGESVLHIQKQGGAVRDLMFSFEKDGYVGNNLSILAEHLFDGHNIVSWTYQKTPDSVIWAVRDDGVLLGLTYMKEHEIWGWHRHTTDGKFKWVASIGGDTEDNVYFVVERVINGDTKTFVERLTAKQNYGCVCSAWHVDSGVQVNAGMSKVVTGLGHLEGKEVAVLASGSPVSGLTVVDGSITLPFLSEIVIIGLPYTGHLVPMSFQAETERGTSQGAPQMFGDIDIQVNESIGGKVGVGDVFADVNSLAFDDLLYPNPGFGQMVVPFTGFITISSPGGCERGLVVHIKQDQPLPLTISAIAADVNISVGF